MEMPVGMLQADDYQHNDEIPRFSLTFSLTFDLEFASHVHKPWTNQFLCINP